MLSCVILQVLCENSFYDSSRLEEGEKEGWLSKAGYTR